MSDRIIYKNSYMDINIKKGPCRYITDSAMGKSYFPSVANSLKEFMPVMHIKSDSAYKGFINGTIAFNSANIYFFDRFDLFYSDIIVNMILEHRDYCSILDLKNPALLDLKSKEFEMINIKRLDSVRWEVKSAFLFRR